MVRKKQMDQVIRVGVSTCLLGKRVRFDGGHKHDRYVTDILGCHVTFRPVCPEIEVGMGVPRESVHLTGTPEAPRMVGTKTGTDWTDRMNRYARERVQKPDIARLCGYILKNRSPSCGMERVRVYRGPGAAERTGVGLFARALIERYPHLPVEEEGRLNDARLRENFVVRVFAYHRLKQLFGERFSRRRFVEFHTAHKYLLMAHSPQHYSELGRLVAAIKKYNPAEFRQRYQAVFMEGLSRKGTVKKNVNVLYHIMGFLKDRLSADEKRDILTVIEDYHRELVPLIVPVTLINHYVKKLNIEYVLHQLFLSPHPKELMLRNHV